ncbi:ABC transporter permease [Ornithinimicrobium sufpigmenti]|uniref:ABC transporter permease n=1 Tax=Ornithinimicrobium sufpigmenti TaxID=2508882 RepID=UPI001036424B|nr:MULTISPECIES: FtsX-like permease family protein [unclassified Ornithinimicrobium]
MRPLLLVREALATAWATKVPTVLVLLLVATMCAATIATVGRTAAAEQQLQARLDSAGSRVLVVADARGEGLLSPTVIDQATGLSTAERAVGTLIPIDVVNGVIGQGGTRVPAWGVHGDLSTVATLTGGRWPGPGEAIVTQTAMDRLGMDYPVGWVAQASTTVVDDWSVVGSFTPREPFGDYATGVLYAAPEGRDLDALHVVLTTADAAEVTQSQVLRLIDPPAPDALTITSPVSLAQLQDQVTGDLALFGRTLLLGVLGAGALLVAIVTLADVLVRRADLGRRRALGATRTTIITLVLLRTLLPASVGAALGTAVGILLTRRLDATPPWDFTTGTATLALLAAATAAVPPALYAATRDPVRVLRTP